MTSKKTASLIATTRGEAFTNKPIRDALRRAIADYMDSEGCDCCRDIRPHKEAKERIAKLLRVPMYEDGSGYNFEKFRTNPLREIVK